MINENRDGLEIDLQKLLMAYLSKWWQILVSVGAGALAALIFTMNFITPMYQAKITVYVNNLSSDQVVEYITNTNLATAQRLVATYVNIIKSDTVLEKVAEASGTDVTVAQLRAMMSAEQVESTELFDVVVTHADPEQAALLANAIAEVAPDEIAEFVEGSSTKIIDYAKVPEKPSSPSLSKNTVLGALVGLVAALAWVTLGFLLDVRIRGEEDLEAMFDIPVLAQVPTFLPEGAKRSGAYAKKAYENGEKRGDK